MNLPRLVQATTHEEIWMVHDDNPRNFWGFKIERRPIGPSRHRGGCE